MRQTPEKDWKKKTNTVCMGDWAQNYMNYAKVKFAEKTYEEKKAVFKRFFKDVEPSLPVSDLKPARVLTFLQNQMENRSGYGANKDRKNLVAAWNWGMKYMDPVLPGPNPCLVEKMSEQRAPRYVPPEEDFWKVYDLTEGQDKVMLYTFLHIGARRGEIFGLEWPDVDFGNNRIRLWTRKRKDGTYEYDWLPMTRKLKNMLYWWLENRPFKDKSHLFLCLDSTPFCDEYYGKPFQKRRHFMKRMCEKAGVKHFGFHAIRHLTASILYSEGQDLSVIQAILRHKSPSTTERYLKTLGLEKVRNALDECFDERGGEKSPQNKKPSEEPSGPQATF